MPGQKSFIGNKRLGFYTDKYGIHITEYKIAFMEHAYTL